MRKNKGIPYVTAFLVMFLLAPLSIAILAHTTSSSDEKLVSEFLGISGLDMSSCSISSFNESTSMMPNSQGYLTAMKAEISGDNAQFDVLVCLVDGKIWSYTLSGNFSTGELNRSALLTRADNVLKGYQAFSNASYCSEFVGLLSTAMQTQSSSAENEDFALKISHITSVDNAANITIEYRRKVGGYTVQGVCFSISISKSGLLCSFLDNMMYYVATTGVNVTEAEAIALATPYATAYANISGQTIVATNATLYFTRDIWHRRSDDFAIYPEWTVFFRFDKVSKEGIFGYAVGIWADNGQVYYNNPQGYFSPSNSSSDSPSDIALDANAPNWQIIAIVVGLFALLPIAITYLKHRTGSSGK